MSADRCADAVRRVHTHTSSALVLAEDPIDLLTRGITEEDR